MSFNFMAAVTVLVILEPRKIKSVTVSTVSTVSPSICHEVMGPDAMICFLNVEGFFFNSFINVHPYNSPTLSI